MKPYPAARMGQAPTEADGTAPAQPSTSRGDTGSGPQGTPRTHRPHRRNPASSAAERARRAEWGKTWGDTMREIVQEHRAKEA